MNLIDTLLKEMIAYYAGDPMRIQHFIKVHSFAKLIGQEEQLDKELLLTLEAAAIVHDIGIKAAEQKYGDCNGKLQEQEGPAIAKQMLERLNIDETRINRICYLVGHHHTYTNVDGIDYQILLEADFLVNIYEDKLSREAAKNALNNIFKTKTGSSICKQMFRLDE